MCDIYHSRAVYVTEPVRDVYDICSDIYIYMLRVRVYVDEDTHRRMGSRFYCRYMIQDIRYKNPERQTNTNIKINTLKQLQNQYNIQLWLQKIYIHLTHINLFSIHQCITHQCINHHSTYISHSSTCINTHIRSSFIHQHTSFIHPQHSSFIHQHSSFVHQHSCINTHHSFIHIHASTFIIHSFINIHASTFITRYLNTSYMHHTSKTSHITNYV